MAKRRQLIDAIINAIMATEDKALERDGFYDYYNAEFEKLAEDIIALVEKDNEKQKTP